MRMEDKKKLGALAISLIFLSLVIFAFLTSESKSEENCYPNPLLESGYVPKTPTKEDYLKFTNFGDEKTVEDILYFLSFNLNNTSYSVRIYYNKNVPEGINNLSIVIYSLFNNSQYKKGYVSNMKIQVEEESILLLSQNGIFSARIYPGNSTSLIELNTNILNAKLIFHGKTFWYNHGDVAEIFPNKFVWGFEIVGEVEGTANDNRVKGFGYFERLNFNVPLENSQYFLNWLVFVSDNISGIIYTHGEYRDGGIWIGNNYIQPSDFHYTYLNTDKNGVVEYSFRITYRGSNNNFQDIIIKGQRVFFDPISSVYASSISYNSHNVMGTSYILFYP